MINSVVVTSVTGTDGLPLFDSMLLASPGAGWSEHADGYRIDAPGDVIESILSTEGVELVRWL